MVKRLRQHELAEKDFEATAGYCIGGCDKGKHRWLLQLWIHNSYNNLG